MESQDAIVGHYVPLSVDLDRVFGNHFSAETGQILPSPASKPHQMILGKSTDDNVVRDVVIFGSGPIRINGALDVFDAAMLDGEATRSREIFVPSPKGEICISNGQSFEIVVIRRHHVEQVVGAIAI